MEKTYVPLVPVELHEELHGPEVVGLVVHLGPLPVQGICTLIAKELNFSTLVLSIQTMRV